MDRSQTEPSAAAEAYLKAMAGADFATAAACIHPADLEAWHRALVSAAQARKEATGADDTRRFAPKLRTLKAFAAAAPVDAFAAFLAGSTKGVIEELPALKLRLTSVRGDSARAHYRYVTSDPSHPLSDRAGVLELTRYDGAWTVRMKVPAIEAQQEPELKKVRAARAGDRATFTAWQDLFPVSVDDEWGFIDRRGKLLIQPRFRRASGFSEGLAAVKVGKQWGYIDGLGKHAIEPRFDRADDFDAVGLAPAALREDDELRWGVIDRNGEFKIEPRFERVQLCGRQELVVCEHADDGGFIVLDVNGQERSPRCDDATEAVQHATEGRWHYDADNGLMVPALRDLIFGASAADMLPPLAEGQTHQRAYFADEDVYALFDAEGRLASDGFATMNDFAGGYAAIRVDDQWGYIDASGEVVIEPQFDNAFEFGDGAAPVLVGEVWGYIDGRGKWLVKPRFDTAWPFVRGLAQVEDGDGGIGYLAPDGRFVWKPRQ